MGTIPEHPPTRRTFLRRSAALLAGAAGARLLAACDGGGTGGGAGRQPPGTTGAAPRVPPPRRPADLDIATAAFYAGFPLVTTVRTLQTFAGLVGVNTVFATPGLVDPTSRLVVAPNRDTVYAIAVLDLRSEAQVLSVPGIPDRYHVLHVLDAWMGNVALVGTRTTGGAGGTYAIVGPGHAAVPAGMRPLRCPTPLAFLLGRIRAVDDADAVAASAIGERVRIEGLASATGGTPPGPPPAIGAPPGTPQSVGANGAAYFDELGDALAVNPPVTRPQRAAVERAASLGIGPGEHPAAQAGAREAALLARAVRDGRRGMAAASGAGVRHVNGWSVNLGLGEPEQDLRQRAAVARYYWGPVPAEEAVYPRATRGSDGRPLDGRTRYRIHFPAGGLPPVDAFWSYTVYGPDMFLVPNDAGRYSISGDTPGLARNADGSLDLLLQTDPPAGREGNWLPVPAGPFHLVMRCYLPRAPILAGTYEYPPVEALG